MRAVCVGMLLIAMTVAGCASSSGESYAATGYNFASLDKVAIVEVTGRVYGDAAKNQIANMFVMELMKKGYTVVERSQVKTVLKEQEFQASDLASDQGAAKAGVIGLVWYDQRKTWPGGSLLMDWRIDTSVGAEAAFRVESARAGFGHPFTSG